ncbi:MAG: hypothetical protein JKY34_07330 [Kordiimonadaceae bacterium]|nr:hypothetical protein [Kordiimonadaceae bacterium]
MLRPWVPLPGQLRHKAKLSCKSDTLANQWENESPADIDQGPFWCAVRTRAVGETEDTSGLVTKTRFDVYFRYQAALAAIATDSILEFTDGALKGQKIHVLAVDPMDGLQKWLKFVCEARNK